MGRLSILFAEMRSIEILEKFFTCLKFIYINSKPPIKLIQKVSSIIDVTIGTEQGILFLPSYSRCLFTTYR